MGEDDPKCSEPKPVSFTAKIKYIVNEKRLVDIGKMIGYTSLFPILHCKYFVYNGYIGQIELLS